MKAEDIDVKIVPNKPFIKSMKLAYMDTTGLTKGDISLTNIVDTVKHIDSVIVKDRSVDLKNIWAQISLETGCKIVPLENAPKFGAYGDFSKPGKYRVTAPSGRTADWTLVVDYYKPVIGILDDRWTGNLNCTDDIWPGYSPTYCKGEKINNSATQVRLTFNFWGDNSLVTVLDLDLGAIDLNTYKGSITLLSDYTVGGYTFHKGAAGTYNASSNELNLEISFSGYTLPKKDGIYRFTVKK